MAAPISRDEEKTALYASLSFVVVVIVIGIPLWWKTTEVYRVPLPTSRVDSLFNAKFIHTIPVKVILTDNSVNKAKLWESLNTESTYMFHQDKPMYFNYQWTVREMVPEEEHFYSSSKNILEFDKLLNSPELLDMANCGGIDIFILPVDTHLTSKDITIGVHRQAYILNSKGFEMLLDQLFHTVKEHCIQSSVLEKVFVPSKPRVRVQPEKEVMRPIRSVPIMDIVFSLIVAEPQALNVNWNIEEAEIAYILPIVKKLLPLTQVNIKSQVLYMMTLNTMGVLDPKTGEHVLPAARLPSIINPIETKLGMQVSINPSLNFVIYVPPVSDMPLQIYDPKGVRVDSNSFLSPQWGSVLIHNFPETLNLTGKDLPLPVAVNMHKSMEALVAHMRLLIGLPEKPTEIKTMEFLQNSEGNDLELDFLLRRGIQERISNAVSSLTSLLDLLNTISNIVITDEIGDKITSSVDAIENCLEHLQNGRLFEAFAQSKNAFVYSEQAFFDPSLLAMLYFPNDQKYAVYIPLFLPVSLPVLMSFRQFYKYFRRTDEAKQHTKIE